MNILVSNHNLDIVGGSETFSFTLIEELKKRNHNVEYFCFNKGFVSQIIEKKLGVKFASKNHYDLILANHNSTVEELYKKGFTIQTCHGIYPKLEQPSPKAHGHISVSPEIQLSLFKKGYSSLVIYNGINCQRFFPDKPLRQKNIKVLSMCHSEAAHEKVQEACQILNFEFGILDKYNDGIWNVEEKINQYDLIVGIGRTVYEALACGRPVVIFDERKYAGSFGDGYFIDIMPISMQNNCTGRALGINFTTNILRNELGKYNQNDGIIARKFAENIFNISKTVNNYFEIFPVMQDLYLNRKKQSLKNILPERLLNMYRKIRK